MQFIEAVINRVLREAVEDGKEIARTDVVIDRLLRDAAKDGDEDALKVWRVRNRYPTRPPEFERIRLDLSDPMVQRSYWVGW